MKRHRVGIHLFHFNRRTIKKSSRERKGDKSEGGDLDVEMG